MDVEVECINICVVGDVRACLTRSDTSDTEPPPHQPARPELALGWTDGVSL